MKNRQNTLRLVQFSLLLAIEAVMCFTRLGSVPIGTAIVATLAMIPVAVAGILMGIGAGALMGFFAGAFSFCVWTFTPPNPLMAFVFTPFYSLGEMRGNFWSLVICFVPRILTGVVASIVYRSMSGWLLEKGRSEKPAYITAGALGSLVNTFGVMGGVYIFFGKEYAIAFELAYEALLAIIGGVILTNGVAEAIICALVCVAVCVPVKKATRSV